MVVEDELLVAMLIEDTLTDQDCVVIGPFTSVPEALAAAQDVRADLAVLDVNLRGEKVYPVAEILTERGIPFLLLSGYGSDAIPADRPNWQACSKPFGAEELVRRLVAQLERHADPAPPLA
jgi:DNA-binding response OmpR family regulator